MCDYYSYCPIITTLGQFPSTRATSKGREQLSSSSQSNKKRVERQIPVEKRFHCYAPGESKKKKGLHREVLRAISNTCHRTFPPQGNNKHQKAVTEGHFYQPYLTNRYKRAPLGTEPLCEGLAAKKGKINEAGRREL